MNRVDKKAFYRLTRACCGREFESYGNRNRKYCRRVVASNTLIFVLNNGRTIEKQWQNKSRKDSWSVELTVVADDTFKEKAMLIIGYFKDDFIKEMDRINAEYGKYDNDIYYINLTKIPLGR